MKNVYITCLISTLLLCFHLDSKSQNTKHIDPVIWGASGFERAPSYTDVIGSPYLFDTWQVGIVTLENGKRYNDVKLKYDQIKDQLIFMIEEGKAMDFDLPVIAFDIFTYNADGVKSELTFINGFPPIDGANDKSFYQVFNPGPSPKLEFVKRVKKKIYTRTVYSSAVKEQLIEDQSYYYLLMNKKLFKIKRNIKSVMSYMNDHKAEVLDYIAKNKLTFKDDRDFASVIKFYNSLS